MPRERNSRERGAPKRGNIDISQVYPERRGRSRLTLTSASDSVQPASDEIIGLLITFSSCVAWAALMISYHITCILRLEWNNTLIYEINFLGSHWDWSSWENLFGNDRHVYQFKSYVSGTRASSWSGRYVLYWYIKLVFLRVIEILLGESLREW